MLPIQVLAASFKVEGRCVDARTGKPASGITIHAVEIQGRGLVFWKLPKREQKASTVTDGNGAFELQLIGRKGWVLEVIEGATVWEQASYTVPEDLIVRGLVSVEITVYGSKSHSVWGRRDEGANKNASSQSP